MGRPGQAATSCWKLQCLLCVAGGTLQIVVPTVCGRLDTANCSAYCVWQVGHCIEQPIVVPALSILLWGSALSSAPAVLGIVVFLWCLQSFAHETVPACSFSFTKAWQRIHGMA